jgi:hypothetical protein
MLQLTTDTNVKIDIYNDVRELSIGRYQRFSAKYLEQSVGSDIFAAEGHMRRIAVFMSGGNQEALKEEFNQLVYNFNNIKEGVHGEAVALAALVQSIDGQVCQDMSDTGLLSTARRLIEAGLTQGQLTEALDSVKKALSANS